MADHIRRRHNWKARQQKTVEIDQDSLEKARQLVDRSAVSGEKRGHDFYGNEDESNALVMPSKKTKNKAVSEDLPTAKPLTKKQRRQLECKTKRKDKNMKRLDILARLKAVQPSQQIMEKFRSTVSIQGKHKGDTSMDLVQLETLAPVARIGGRRISSIKLSKGQKKRDRLLREALAAKKKAEEPLSSSSEEETDEEEEVKKSEPEAMVVEDKKTQEVVEQKKEQKEASRTEKMETEEQEEKLKEALKKEAPQTEEALKKEAPQTEEAPKEEAPQKEEAPKKEEPQKEEAPTKGKTEQSTKKPVVRAERKTVHIPVYRTEKIQAQRDQLPVVKEEQTIMEEINKTDVVIVHGLTGSGKTTQLPQFLYEAGYAHGDGIIGVTQPRRVAATSVAKRVAEEMNLSSSVVSYQIRYEGNCTADTKIKFMTDGVLKMELMSDKYLMKYSVIIIDEAHERSVDTDILIGRLSIIVPVRAKANKPLKLIIMSATLRVEDFTKNPKLFPTPPPVISVDGQQYDVKAYFPKHTPADYMTAAFNKVCLIHRTKPGGGILVFVTSELEVKTLSSKLKRLFPSRTVSTNAKNATEVKNVENAAFPSTVKLEDFDAVPDYGEEGDAEGDDYLIGSDDEDDEDDLDLHDDIEADMACAKRLGMNVVEEPLHVLKLYSKLDSEEQAKVFEAPPAGHRLCVISTNVAEASVTIPHIKYVVDTGKMKNKHFDKVTGVEAFQIEWISKASANQRAGRAGRVRDGICYRLYSSAIYNDEFATFPSPAITRCPVDNLVLYLKSMNILQIDAFPFPTPPDAEAIATAEKLLFNLGALEKKKTVSKGKKPSSAAALRISKLGKMMARLCVAPRYAKMLCVAKNNNLAEYVLLIVAACSVPQIFETSMRWSDDNEEANDEMKKTQKIMTKLRRKFGEGHPLGDALVMLKIVANAEIIKDKNPALLAAFIQQYGIREKALKEISKLRRQLTMAANREMEGCDLCIDSVFEKPSDDQLELLQVIMLQGHIDHVARRAIYTPGKDKKLKNSYVCIQTDEPVFIHPTSPLFEEKKMPEYVIYQTLEETSKLYMKGVTGINPTWLPEYAPHQCHLSPPLETPEPYYDTEESDVYCHRTAKFGPHSWPIPAVPRPYPEGPEKLRWFARFLLDGSMFPKLARFTCEMVVKPQTMIKSWYHLQPKTKNLLCALIEAKAYNKDTLIAAWKTQPNALLKQYKQWVPSAYHPVVEEMWPPVEEPLTTDDQ